MSEADLARFRMFVDDSGERLHIHERDDGEDRCVTQPDADTAAAWAVRLWDAKKKMETEA